MKTKVLIILSYLIVCLFYIQLGDSAIYETLYHSDNLFLPLFSNDLNQWNFSHWYLPPSNYLFPDAVAMCIFSFIVPDLSLPIAFGILNLILLQLSTFLYLRILRGERFALKMNLFSLLLLSLLGSIFFFDGSRINPFVYLMTSGHHISVIYILFFSLYLFKKIDLLDFDRNDLTRNLKYHCMRFLHLAMLVLIYASDRFVIIYFSTFLLSQFRNRKYQKYFLLFLLAVILGEFFHYMMSLFFRSPSSFEIFFKHLNNTNIYQILIVLIHYLYDFIKFWFYQVSFGFSIAFLICLLSFVFGSRSFSTQVQFVHLYGILSFLFLIVVGRFVYLHPFPIRYMVGYFYLAFFFGMLSILVRLGAHKLRLEHIAIFNLIFISLVFICFQPVIQERTALNLNLREQVVAMIRIKFGNNAFKTDYHSEKKIRFYSQNLVNPYPFDHHGKPYFWITGAFQPAPSRLGISEGEIVSSQTKLRFWIPNSLTKDF
jgi:hypothetical protein